MLDTVVDDLADLRGLSGAARISRARKLSRERFEFWTAYAVKIRDKLTGRLVPFVLNNAQRKVVAELEAMRRADQPIRIIVLKSRQWGCSTLLAIYMAWIQIVHRQNWNSVILAHLKDTAKVIRNMFDTLLANYPVELLDGKDTVLKFKSFQGSQNTREITGRGCLVSVASAESQDSVRGSDIAMAHLSEVAFWPETPGHDPRNVIRSVCGSVVLRPLTVVALESTASGVGSYFHTEWLRAVEGKSDKRAIFISWRDIEIYRMEVDDVEALWSSLTAYEKTLWQMGCSLEQINWHRHKLAEYSTPADMHAEFPTTAEEAFTTSGANVFANDKIEALRTACQPGERGELGRGGFTADAAGNLVVWWHPGRGEHYVVAVDIGGRTAKADWSVACVMRIAERPEVVAQWRGHIDHDLLADKVMALARYYNRALLVIESNSLESKDDSSSVSILERVSQSYTNTYHRTKTDAGGKGVGFHTNAKTKPLVINGLIAAVRDGQYIERDTAACTELATYMRNPNGSYAARPGQHDDMLMTRAIALHIIENLPATTDNDDVSALFSGETW